MAANAPLDLVDLLERLMSPMKLSDEIVTDEQVAACKDALSKYKAKEMTNEQVGGNIVQHTHTHNLKLIAELMAMVAQVYEVIKDNFDVDIIRSRMLVMPARYTQKMLPSWMEAFQVFCPPSSNEQVVAAA